jgi:hypothetical protein
MTDHDIKIADRYWKDMKQWSSASLQKPWCFQVNVLLLSSYLYYQMITQILTDEQYDQLCAHLLKHYDEAMATNIWHKKLIPEASLKAGSLFDLKFPDYPPVIRSVAYDLIRRIDQEVPEGNYLQPVKTKAPLKSRVQEAVAPKKKASFDELFE